ncbi:hypothetical protein [Methylobacillus sp.]|uniref:hypothetical protein n=1 Tax=Methylobacillus sp. TaxID=56818 RepID=UPI00257CB93E|nr:hypothetical protein [Methylobacillus sp.]
MEKLDFESWTKALFYLFVSMFRGFYAQGMMSAGTNGWRMPVEYVKRHMTELPVFL